MSNSERKQREAQKVEMVPDDDEDEMVPDDDEDEKDEEKKVHGTRESRHDADVDEMTELPDN
ncbi:hypothetical protein IF2G_01230 [Cordyceps javanica]|nr:hypothetical protein IF2G_01230 [Cordyceps javanica]